VDTRPFFLGRVGPGNEASQLFEAGADEKIIQSRSAHRSTDALWMHEHIAQQQAVSNILTSGEEEFGDEMEVVSAQTAASLCTNS